MPFTYKRKIYFQQTDAAGVVYFTNTLSICHEAYEEALEAVGILLQSFCQSHEIALPITHAEIDFYHPLRGNDRITVQLTPQLRKPSEFAIAYQIYLDPNPPAESPILAAQARTRHVCIHPVERCRQDLPSEMMQWLQQSV